MYRASRAHRAQEAHKAFKVFRASKDQRAKQGSEAPQARPAQLVLQAPRGIKEIPAPRVIPVQPVPVVLLALLDRKAPQARLAQKANRATQEPPVRPAQGVQQAHRAPWGRKAPQDLPVKTVPACI